MRYCFIHHAMSCRWTKYCFHTCRVFSWLQFIGAFTFCKAFVVCVRSSQGFGAQRAREKQGFREQREWRTFNQVCCDIVSHRLCCGSAVISFFPLLVLLLSKSFVAQKMVLSHLRTAVACIQSGVLSPRPTCPWVKVLLLVPRNSQNKASRKFLRIRRQKQPENAKFSKIPTSRNDRANPCWSGSGIASERLYLFECVIGRQFIVFSCMERLKAWSQSLYGQMMVVRFWR